ncbi:MAG TPA: DUF134 domain-containing protein [Thermoleophilia bacterium]|nr:DUF134 domain-containing protein [Thermoleophilia bacterium]
MPRRPIQRLVTGLPPAELFKPAGVPMRQLETVELAIDELEAMRLVDHEGLSHEEAAHYLGVSRQTAGRVVESARRKVADALLGGKALAIGGGAYRVAAAARCCNDCGARWAVGEDETAGDERCPSCGSTQVGVCRGFGPGHGRGRGRMQGGAGHGAAGRGGGGDCGPGDGRAT